MSNTRKELSNLFSQIPLILIGVFLFTLPLLFSIQMTEAFLLPKHLLLAVIITISMISLSLRMVAEGKIRIRTTPFDIPVVIFTLVVIFSAYFSVNKFDSLIAAIPFMYAALLFYIIINSVRSEKALLFILSSLLLGTTIAAFISILAFFKIYPLPFAYTRTPSFTPIGSLLDQALYFVMVAPLAGYFAMRFLSGLNDKQTLESEKNSSGTDFIFTISFLIITAGFIVTLFYLLTSQAPYLLPFGSGFQIAFAAISQDAGRLIKSFLLGSGYGTFITDFTRFKQPSYNADTTLWAVSFLRSSSFVLELLATTGILGVISFLYIVLRIVRERVLFLPLIMGIVAAFIIPFSPLIVTLFFAILGIFAIVRVFSEAPGFEEIDLHLIAFRERVNAENVHAGNSRGKQSAIISAFMILLLLSAVGVVDYYVAKFAISDITFQKSLIAASKNNGSETYRLQADAIKAFPYRDVYHRVFSQTNLSLANSLAQQTPQGSSPSAAVQQNVLTLIQQSINTGRSASTISPLSAANWNNLSGVYRSLIGFGQNADQFAVLTNQQAITLDPSNPQQYVNLGGIYYQLGLWDEAIRQFQIAIRLKPDYTNAYYNAGHALEAKGNLTQALTVYEAVKTMVVKEKAELDKMTSEIEALKKKISDQSVAGAATEPTTQASPQPTPTEEEDGLSVNQPPAVLPTRNPQAPIDGPSITPAASPTGTVNPSPTPKK